MKLIYTCLFGNTDTLKDPLKTTPGWDYICYTNRTDLTSTVWNIITVAPQPLLDERRQSRYWKIVPDHPKEYDTTIYVDATYQVLGGSLDEFAKGKEEGVWMTAHPQRSCLYKEARVVRQKKLEDPLTLHDQILRYRLEDYPEHAGLYRCGVILRNKGAEKFSKVWWDEIERGTWRDQVSCPYASRKTGIKINPIPHGQVERCFGVHLHSPKKISSVIHFVEDPEKIPNISKNDWVCIGDFNNVNSAITTWPEVHAMFSPNGGILFQRWLYDYIWQLDRMLEFIKIYRGTYVLWNG